MLFAWVLLACSPSAIDSTDSTGATDDPGTTDTSTTTWYDPTTVTDTGAAEILYLRARAHERYPTLIEVGWTQTFDGEVVVEYRFDEDGWRQAPPVQGVVGRNARLLVGIPYSAEVEWRVTSERTDPKAAEETFVVEDPPPLMPVPVVTTSVPEAWSADNAYLLTSVSETRNDWGSAGPYHTMLVDRKGRVIWSNAGTGSLRTLYPQVSVSGDHLLLDRFAFPTSAADEAFAIRLHLDEEIERIGIPGHHHAFIELPDGTLAWGSRWNGEGGHVTGNYNEALVEKAPGEEGNGTVVWRCKGDWFEADAFAQCRSNALHYDPASDTYTVSFYTLQSVVAIERSTADVVWWAGSEGPDNQGYTFVPSESQFWWQHGVNITAAGTLLVSSHDGGFPASTNLGIEYAIESNSRVLRRIWDYDAGELAEYNGDIKRAADGHTLHQVGTACLVNEADENGDIVWQVDFDQGSDTRRTRLMGTASFVADPYALLSPDSTKVGITAP